MSSIAQGRGTNEGRFKRGSAQTDRKTKTRETLTNTHGFIERPDTRLPQSRTGGQEQCWRRSLGHLGGSTMLKKLKKRQEIKRGPT